MPNERFSDRYEELLGYAEELEAEVLGMIRRRRESREQGNDVLSILVRTHDEEGGLSDEELVGQAAVLFGGSPHDDGPFADLDAASVCPASVASCGDCGRN